jgi:glutamate-1-semialdehyde aminotransferase
MAISVLGQLSEEHQFAWLRELKRVARKDATVMVAIPGLAKIGLARPHPGLLREIEEKGFLVTGRNSDLDDVMPDQTHYISVLHSRDYLHTNWDKYFTIIDIVDGIAANDDLVLMKNDKPAQVMISDIAPSNHEPRTENPFSLPLRDYDINPFIHPTTAKSGYGGHLVDMNGKDYVDFMSAWGTNLLGYGYRKVARAAARQTRRFNSLGLPYPQFQDLMSLMRKVVPTAEAVRYGKNGSDACAGAVRLVRFITGREKILYRGYHGFHDWYFAATDCPGIPVALKSTVISQSELTPAAVDAAFRRHPNEIAGLILNPLVGPFPTSDEIREVIEVIHRHGGLVIFDEMMSGFRVALGGMQELWGVKPDLSCFGKSIANGLPLSVLCGKSEYMRRLPETYYGMTFEGEAVSIAAAYATLTEVIEKNVVAALYEKGRSIRTEYQRLAKVYNLSTSLIGYEPCMHMDFQAQGSIPGRQLLWLMNQELVRNGIFTLGAFILCFSHDRRDLRKLERAFDSSMSVLRQAVDRGTTEGLLDERIRQCMEDIKGPANWRRAQS